ncbi:histidine protein methyltransferase 1 homolog isoform X2 [Anthonomus grandis grandis]|uniref:histidine protein methyltransferase 1 homolog isoform X2 n=1 Tax=Anthonomus grandis grandis TaxID=2921223 RepID=UPI0021668429|nr:histidine protein methyltransferase 1 homolog isoform X2 [Anthonomus grandis grandis]
MFKFNFSEQESSINQDTPRPPEAPNPTKSEQYVPEKDDNDVIKDIFTNCEEIPLSCGIKYFSTGHVLDILRSNEVSGDPIAGLSADEQHSDLQNGVYEGGLKVWECTFDLINHLTELKLDLKGKNVLDLGCGAGLLGILSLHVGALRCTFQDYNLEVLKYVTVPNLKLNGEELLDRSEFYSGDWESFFNQLTQKFDLILTSETIYNIDCYEKLHSTFEKLLKPDGAIYLAAKSYYFGVGGGIALFEDFLSRKNTFKAQRSWSCSEGLKREILEITFR